jgi:hypothetical protein
VVSILHPECALAIAGPYPATTTVLTVEMRTKWYRLWLVRGEERTPLHFGMIDDGKGTAFVDHVPNPEAVRRFADKNGYWLDELADDLIAGRWANEVCS